MAKSDENKTEAYKLIAAFFESVGEAKRLAKAEPALINSRTGLGETPLHYLAVEDRLAAVQALVELGAEVNTVNNCGGTPLSEAASLGYTDLVKYLLSVNAKLFLEGQNHPVLHNAVRSGKIELVKILIDAGADVNGPDDLNETPLHVAVENDQNLEIAKFLIRSGADVNAKQLFDETPLAVAEKNGATSIVAEMSKSDPIR